MSNLPPRSYTEEANQFIKDMGFSQKQFRKKFAKNSVIVSYAALDDDGSPIIVDKVFTDADPKPQKKAANMTSSVKVIVDNKPRTFPTRNAAIDWLRRALADARDKDGIDSDRYKNLYRLFDKAESSNSITIID